MNRKQLLKIGCDVLIIDGMNLSLKSAYSLRGLKSGGQDTGVVYGFLNSLSTAARQYLPSGIVITWEGKNNKDIRREIYPEYKANRKKSKDIDIVSVFEQIDILQDFVYHMGIATVRVDGYEADDCIASLVKIFPDKECVIMTSDRDLLQLITPKVKWYSSGSFGQTKEINFENFQTETGVSVDRFLDYKIIKGDSSDGIPGIAGVGKKTAQSLLDKFTLKEYLSKYNEETALPRTKKLFEPEAKEILERNRRLMDLNEFVIPKDELFSEMELEDWEEDGLLEMLNDYEMWSILDNFSEFKSGFEGMNTRKALEIDG